MFHLQNTNLKTDGLAIDFLNHCILEISDYSLIQSLFFLCFFSFNGFKPLGICNVKDFLYKKKQNSSDAIYPIAIDISHFIVFPRGLNQK